MTWTYTADPTSSAKDAVRFLVGDTMPDAEFTMQDEEIAWNLAEVSQSVYLAAANSAENLAALYASQATEEAKTVGGLEISRTFTDRAKRFATLAQMLLARNRRVNPPFASADRDALGAEFHVGKIDPYYAHPTDWPHNSVTGVSTQDGDDSSSSEYGDI